MANQGISIVFLENASQGDNIKYEIRSNGTKLVFVNGLDNIAITFTNSDSEIASDPLHKVKIGIDKFATAQNTKVFLETKGYSVPGIQFVYSVKFRPYPSETEWPTGTAEVRGLIVSNTLLTFDSQGNNYLTVIPGSFNENPIPTTAPKYFFQYKNLSGEQFKCEIYQKDFAGTTTEINGRAIIVKGDATNHFTPIRGTGLELKLQASKDLSFTDLYSFEENVFSVKLYRLNIIIFQGFLKPDGLYQSYTDNEWDINLQCVDGLGLLADLAFVKSDGVPYTGKIRIIDIIRNCLNRTGLKLRVNTLVDIEFYGMVTGFNVDVLASAYINTDRFRKSDKETISSCQEVLESILSIFSAVLTQENGEWFIYRPSAVFLSSNPSFRRYEVDGVNPVAHSINLKRIIGSQIDGFGKLHHCNRNQKIELKGAIASFRLGYKYSDFGGFLRNEKLQHVAGTNVFDGWTVNTWTQDRRRGRLYSDPASTTGIKFISAMSAQTETYPHTLALTSTGGATLQAGYTLEFKVSMRSYGYPSRYNFTVYVGDYSLNWIDGSWQKDVSLVIGVQPDYPLINNSGTVIDPAQFWDKTYTISSQPIPEDGVLRITANVPVKAMSGTSGFVLSEVVSEIRSINVTVANTTPIVGEFHTVGRVAKVSSIVKDNKNVQIGDSLNSTYLGAIYQANQTALTSNWYRRQFPGSEVKPLLRIAAEEELRIAQKPLKLFSGDVFGFVSYLCRLEINKIEGFFMPISWSYDTFTDITTMKSLELYAPELPDIKYERTDDYGETVKPTIV